MICSITIVWTGFFLGDEDEELDQEAAVSKLCRIMVGNDARIRDLVSKHFTLAELKLIRKRTIGSGYIGGKAAGMLIAGKLIEHYHPELYKKNTPNMTTVSFWGGLMSFIHL